MVGTSDLLDALAKLHVAGLHQLPSCTLNRRFRSRRNQLRKGAGSELAIGRQTLRSLEGGNSISEGSRGRVKRGERRRQLLLLPSRTGLLQIVVDACVTHSLLLFTYLRFAFTSMATPWWMMSGCGAGFSARLPMTMSAGGSWMGP